MTITREQVAGLQPGDVVELRHDEWPEGSVWRGPIYYDSDPGWLYVAGAIIRDPNGEPRNRSNGWSLTVISLIPRSLYVNHGRTEPARGDVVRDADDATSTASWVYADPDDPGYDWRAAHPGTGSAWIGRGDMPVRLLLLVDGETGQAVTA